MRFQEHLTSSSYVHARPALQMAQPSRTHYTSCHCRHTRVLIFGGSREKTQMTTRLLFFTSHIFRRHDTVYNVDFKNFESQVYSWTSAKTYGVRFYGSGLKHLIEIQRELVATPTPRIWVMSILHRILWLENLLKIKLSETLKNCAILCTISTSSSGWDCNAGTCNEYIDNDSCIALSQLINTIRYNRLSNRYLFVLIVFLIPIFLVVYQKYNDFELIFYLSTYLFRIYLLSIIVFSDLNLHWNNLFLN